MNSKNLLAQNCQNQLNL